MVRSGRMAPTCNKTAMVKKGLLFVCFQLWGNGKAPQREFQRKGETCSAVTLHFEAAAISCTESLWNGKDKIGKDLSLIRLAEA